jgi:hypothetical protein
MSSVADPATQPLRHAREGLDPSLSTLADQVRGRAARLDPL